MRAPRELPGPKLHLLKGRQIAVALLTMVFLMAPGNLFASDDEPRIFHTQCSLDPLWLRLGFKAENVFSRPDLQEGLEAGNPLTFTYSIRVMQRRKGWIDKMLAEVKAVKTVKRDSLTNRYKATFWVDGVEREFVELESFDEIAQWMVQIPSINLMPAENLTGRNIYLKVMGHFLEDLKMFIPWDYETEWLRVEIPKSNPPAGDSVNPDSESKPGDADQP